MILVKKGYLFALCLLCLACSNNPQYSKKQARELLLSVEKQYKSMETFELEGALNTTVTAAGQNQNMSVPVYYAQDGPGKSRIEIKNNQLGMVNISNDSTSWSYIPSHNEYKKQKMSTLQISGGNDAGVMPSSGITDIASKFTDSFKTISSGVKKASILGEETVTMDDGAEKREAFKLKVSYQDNARPQNMTSSPTTYLIDKKDHLVLKRSVEMKATEDAPRGPFTIYTTYLVNKIDLAPSFADSVFVFNPPKGAREVEKLKVEGQNSSGTSALVGRKAKNFTLTSFSGEQVNLNDLKGKIVVLDFWATWCGPCREAHPNLQSLYEDLNDKGLVVLGINSETAKKVDSYMQTNGYTFRNLKDPNQSVAIDYQVNSIPSVFIIDKKGMISAHLLGYQPKSSLRKAVKEAGL